MDKIDTKKIKRAISKNKPIIFLAALFFLVSVGGTIAHYFTQHQLENNFVTADYNISLSEYFPKEEWDNDNILDKQVTISNNGNADVLLRISYNESWVDKDGYILNNLYEGNEIVEKNWTNEFINDFEYYNGWYYYTKVLTQDDSVDILNTIEKVIDVYNEEGTKYNLDFNYEVLQAENDASESVWGYKATIEGSSVTWEY